MTLAESLLKCSKTAVLAALVAATLCATSGAQSRDTTRQNANRAPAAAQSTQVARSDTALQTLEQHLQNEPVRVSKLVGMEVQSRSGDNLGEVYDVLRGAAPGHDLQLVVATGGSGADQSLVAVPFDEIQIDSDGDELYTNRSREQLAATPVALDHRSHTPRPGAAGQRDAASSSQQRIGDLLGAKVVGSSGDKVGEVDDIVISTAGADSIRAVLQIGGVSGLGEKRISLPLSQFAVERVGDDEPALRVAMDREALERMPEFEYEEQTAAL